MVKMLDENLVTLEHIGIDLWRAALAWKRDFASEMAARGYPWHQEARGEVLAHLGPSGRGQADLVAVMGMTKQAVQQLLDQLAVDEVIAREPDPKDKRAKRIILTELGLADFAERNKVKREIEGRYRLSLGTEAFETLQNSLAKLASL